MEIYVTVKGKVKPEHEANFKALFDLMVNGKIGAALENYVEKVFPAAESALEALLDLFEEHGDTINLEAYQLSQGNLELSFMGGYTLEAAMPQLKEWLSACGVSDLDSEGDWV